jgi:hypothetical protein
LFVDVAEPGLSVDVVEPGSLVDVVELESFVDEPALFVGGVEAAKESGGIAMVQTAHQQTQLGATDSERQVLRYLRKEKLVAAVTHRRLALDLRKSWDSNA